MKEILNFIRWQWQKFERWQKLWIIGCVFFGAGMTAPDSVRNYLIAVPIAIFFIYTFKWWIWEPTIASWESYKKEKAQLFDTIKDSHK